MKSLLLFACMFAVGCQFDVGVTPDLRAQGAECRSVTEAFIQTSPQLGYRDNTVYMCVDNFMYLRSDPSIVLGDCNPALVTGLNCYPSDLPILD